MTERPQLGAESELALLLVGTSARRRSAAERIRELTEHIDEDPLIAVLLRQRVLLLVGSRLLELHPAAMSAAFREQMDRARANARARAMVFSAATGRLTDALDQLAIDSLPLKGPGLAKELYGDETLRDYRDIDVLVAVDDLERAVAAARRVGWTDEVLGHGDAGELPALHRTLVRPGGTLPPLELHWRIHYYETAFAYKLLARSGSASGARIPAPLYQLAALLLFYARDGFAGLRLAADIAAWWDRHGSPATVSQLAAIVRDHPELAESWRTALHVATSVVGLPIGPVPPDLTVHTRRGRLACGLVNWDLLGDVDQIMATVTLIDGLLAPSGQLPDYVRRQLRRHDPSYRASRRSPGTAKIAIRRAAHVAKILVRYALAVATLRSRRSRAVTTMMPARTLVGAADRR
jgi:hypothetical protein